MIRLFVMAALVVAVPTYAQAQSLSLFDKMELGRACSADVETLCGNVEQGNGQMGQCLKDNAELLSEGCSATIAKFRAKLEAEQPAGN